MFLPDLPGLRRLPACRQINHRARTVQVISAQNIARHFHFQFHFSLAC